MTATGLSRAGFLRRSAVGGGALLAAASGLGALAPLAQADTPPDSDLAFLRLLIAAELLAVDFLGRAVRSGRLRHAATALARQIRADEHEHYGSLAAAMVAAGQTPATAGDIDFSYPAATFRSERTILRFAEKLERVLVGAYIDALEKVQTPGLRATMARIAANEAQHHGALAALDGRPVIEKPFPSPVRMDAVSSVLDRYES